MKQAGFSFAAVLLFFCFVNAEFASAHRSTKTKSQGSITNRTVTMPSWQQWQRVILLKDYNTRVVIFGAMLLGCAAGVIGTFTLLRKRALMGDALSHATLPGIAFAFIIATSLGYNGKSLPILLLGATITGLIGVGSILIIRNMTRLKEDTAMGFVLSVFFGAGMSLLGVIQHMKQGHAAGIESFIYGKTASMGAQDATLIASAAIVCVVICTLFFKELKLLCFDEAFAGSRGAPVVQLDLLLMAIVVIVSIVGLQAVGLVLMVALLVIPAAAARFWTEELWNMVLISGLLGALGGMSGAAMSALFSNLPSGAMIVLVCSLFFFLSMLFGSSRGLLVRWLRRARLNRSVDHQHLLRAIYELQETSAASADTKVEQENITISELLELRSWSARHLNRAISRAQQSGYVEQNEKMVSLTVQGVEEAVRLTRQHRLWELYLMAYAEVAPGRVDRDADAIEHVLEPEVVKELETLLEKDQSSIPESPHQLATPARDANKPIQAGE